MNFDFADSVKKYLFLEKEGHKKEIKDSFNTDIRKEEARMDAYFRA